MQWSDINPFVLPYVIGCPDPLVEQHAKLAAIEFCRKTSCWQRTLDAVLADGVNQVVTPTPITGTQIIRIKAVSVAGIDHPLVDSLNGLKLIRSGSTQRFCFTQDNKTLHISPTQEALVAVVVDVVLAPLRTSDTLDDAVGDDYLQDIATGTIASVMRVPNQPWTDAAASERFSSMFSNRMAAVSAKVSRGFLPQKMRSHARYL